jgi:hypothetical protein
VCLSVVFTSLFVSSSLSSSPSSLCFSSSCLLYQEHALKVIGLGAESLNDLSVTRGRFMACVHESAPEWGLKPTTKHIPRALFLEILDRWPRLVR